MNGGIPSDKLDATIRDIGGGQKLFNRYTLQRVLGRGGMGVVWLARDDVLERDVALKFLPELLLLDRAMMDDLKRETKRSLELTHKNIVRIYDFVHDQTSACISMEYVDGDTLSNMRADRPNKVFETRELEAWTKQLCEALDYAHGHAKVIHRDLKPSNLMLNQRADLKVADFGIARSLSDSVSMMTMGRHTSGTLVYMSPQQLDGERGSHLDDIYSLGATLYELLTSKPPFYSGNIDRQIHERMPPRMCHRREEFEVQGEPIDETWENLVAACLQKDPAQRPQSASEIVQLLTASPLAPARKAGWFKFSKAKKAQPAIAENLTPTPKTRPPTAKTDPPIVESIRAPAEIRPSPAEIRPPTAPTPPPKEVPRPPRVPKRRLRRAVLALTAAMSGAVQTTARNAALIVVVPSKALFRGARALDAGVDKGFQSAGAAVAASSKAAFHGLAALDESVEKAFKTVGGGIATLVKAAFNGAVFVVITIGKGFRAVVVALIAGGKVISRWAEIAVVVLAKETVRGTAITIVPAVLAAAVIWFFAVRTPPRKIVAQPPIKTQPIEQPKTQTVLPVVAKAAPSAAPTQSHTALVSPIPRVANLAPSVVPTQSHLTLVSPIAAPATQTTPESTPPPPVEGSLALETIPAGATVIVDGSTIKPSRKDVFVVDGKIHERATVPNLAVGKHHVQIVLPDYKSAEMDADVNAGQVATLGVITLRPITPPQEVAKAKPEAETVKSSEVKAKEERASAAKKATRTRQITAARTQKSPPPVARQAAAPPVTRTVSKPAATPKPAEPKRRSHEFEGSAPGG